jgi:hypothetical protein
MHTEINLLKKQIRLLSIGLLSCSIIMTFFIVSSFTGNESSKLIRTRGIIIEDSLGRDRILIGAPIPASRYRVRTDTALVRKYWAKNYDDSNQYMEWYKNYYHSTYGMVVMNEQGFDRVLMGDKLADPNSGKRMFEASGLMWNNKEGWEMGGLGVNTTKDGKARSVIGVDDGEGEAVHVIALEDGTKGLVIGGENGRLLIGMSKANGAWFQNKEAFTGIKFFNNKGQLVWEQSMQTKQ